MTPEACLPQSLAGTTLGDCYFLNCGFYSAGSPVLDFESCAGKAAVEMGYRARYQELELAHQLEIGNRMLDMKGLDFRYLCSWELQRLNCQVVEGLFVAVDENWAGSPEIVDADSDGDS